MTRVLYVQFTNPGGYPPLEHSAAILAEQGAHVLVLGTTADGTNRMAWPKRPGIRIDIMPKRHSGVAQQVDYIRYAARVIRTLLRERADWVYASDASAAPIALVGRLMTRCRVVYHEHDEPFTVRPSRLTRLVNRARNRLARIADEVAVPNATRGERLQAASLRSAPVRTVWNCPRRHEVRQNTAPSAGPLRMIYQGSIGRNRVPRGLIEVLERVPATELTLIGYETAGGVSYIQELVTEARRRGVSDRLHVLGTIPRSELLATTASCHVGISFMQPTSANPNDSTMVGSSNKAFEYLSCGLALLVSDLEEWRDAFVSAGVARACDPSDVNSLESAVRWYHDHREELAAMGQAGQSRIERDWNYEAQFAPLASVILAGGGSAVAPSP